MANTSTQIAFRKDVYRRFRRLPDDKILKILDFIEDLEEHEPNEETIQAMQDIKNRRDLVSFNSVDEMFAALRSEAEEEENASS
ncbi:hypothetical protein LJC31_08140 [Synergistaceae bacterium OttesenSCG-928-I11]|nr:hypothetical protein [Synergistaceae bacterium OttesenSCG-928-I11]